MSHVFFTEMVFVLCEEKIRLYVVGAISFCCLRCPASQTSGPSAGAAMAASRVTNVSSSTAATDLARLETDCLDIVIVPLPVVLCDDWLEVFFRRDFLCARSFVVLRCTCFQIGQYFFLNSARIRDVILQAPGWYVHASRVLVWSQNKFFDHLLQENDPSVRTDAA